MFHSEDATLCSPTRPCRERGGAGNPREPAFSSPGGLAHGQGLDPAVVCEDPPHVPAAALVGAPVGSLWVLVLISLLRPPSIDPASVFGGLSAHGLTPTPWAPPGQHLPARLPGALTLSRDLARGEADRHHLLFSCYFSSFPCCHKLGWGVPKGGQEGRESTSKPQREFGARQGEGRGQGSGWTVHCVSLEHFSKRGAESGAGRTHTPPPVAVMVTAPLTPEGC